MDSTRPDDRPPVDEADALLLRFVDGRDVPCPRCGYNLRDLQRPACPECREALTLQVGAARVRLLWFLLTIAPGIFCGILAVLMFGVVAFAMVIGAGVGGAPLGFIALASFNAVSGLVALSLMLLHQRFLRQSEPAQVLEAILSWGVHLTAFVVTLSLVT